MTPADPAPTRLSADEYFDLVRTGQLDPDDKVELLEGWWWPWRRKARRTRA